jgi:GNAT superfamily N-acetyltransferase
MPRLVVHLSTLLAPGPRAVAVAGAFDLPLPAALECRVAGELPCLSEPWRVGAIVGPSGSGKTTLARAALGAVPAPVLPPWPKDQALIDALGELACGWPLRELTRLLTAVGLGSVPLWLRPYPVLSTGQQQRADLARALAAGGNPPQTAEGTRPVHGHAWDAFPLSACPRATHDPGHQAPSTQDPSTKGSDKPEPGQQQRRHQGSAQPDDGPLTTMAARHVRPVVVDEFTSGLDRTVACTLSAALARWLRRQQPPRRLVVVSCHDDFLPWLMPDWVVRCHFDRPAELVRGCLRRPPLRLPVTRVPSALWSRFARHHYLTSGLPAAASCFAAWWPDRPGFRPVALCVVAASLGRKDVRRIARLVTLPEFQGLGIASQLVDVVASHYVAAGKRVTLTTGHPAMVLHLMGSPRWRRLRVRRHGSSPHCLAGRPIRSSTGRAVASFVFVGSGGLAIENVGSWPLRPATLPFPSSDQGAEHGLLRQEA